MPRIRFLPDDRVVEASSSATVLDASLGAGIPHTHVCGGNARCSTCRVLIVAGLEHCVSRNAKEQDMAERLRFGPDVRLACQLKITGDVTVRRLVLDAEDQELTDQTQPHAARSQVGDEKPLAILFADIRGFTAFAEKLPPYDVVHALNRYFHRMDKIVRAHRGYVDNYMGDGLLALFGTETPSTAADDAVSAGLEMLEAVEDMNPYFEAVYAHRLRIGIGIHHGVVVLGGIGPPGSRRITAIGDAVNFASRIQEANKTLGTNLLVSSEACGLIKGTVEVRETAEVPLAGRTAPCRLFEIVGRCG